MSSGIPLLLIESRPISTPSRKMAIEPDEHDNHYATVKTPIYPLLKPLPSKAMISPGSNLFVKTLLDSARKIGKPSSYTAETLDGTNLPPKLEETIPDEYLPDKLIVIAERRCVEGKEGKYSQSHHPTIEGLKPGIKKGPEHRYSRVMSYMQQAAKKPQRTKKATLWLSTDNLCGVGHHSSVHRAPLKLPAPVHTNSRSSTGKVSVVAKLAFEGYNGSDENMNDEHDSDRQQLEREAKVFTAIAQKLPHLQQSQEIRKSSGIWHDPAIPKFYGYYKPEDPGSKLSPILLLEYCGQPVTSGSDGLSSLSGDAKEAISGKFNQLHCAGLTQGSLGGRNILKQKGPLCLPPCQRSWDTPLYRIINFGRSHFLLLLDDEFSLSRRAIEYYIEREREKVRGLVG